MNNQLTVFVRASVSRLSEIPGENKLIEAFAVELNMQRLEKGKSYSNDELLQIPQKYLIRNGEENYYEFLKRNCLMI